MSLHSTCANKSANTTIPLTLLVKKGSKWFCDECKPVCNGCHHENKDNTEHHGVGGICLLGCCTCDKNFHLNCLNPVPDKKPKSPWR